MSAKIVSADRHRSCRLRFRNATLMACLFAAASGLPVVGQASPLTIGTNTDFVYLDNLGYNPYPYAPPGVYIRYGAMVSPNGSSGTTGVATATDPITGDVLFTNKISFTPSVASPNFFVGRLSSSDARYGDGLNSNWTLDFTNGTDQASSKVFNIQGGSSAIPVPLISTVTISGTGSNPTFSWQPPADTTVNGYGILISDENSPYGNKVVLKETQDATSYTVAPGSLPDYTNGHDIYQITIRAIQTRDGNKVSSDPTSSNIAAMSEAFFNFNLLSADSPPDVYLPALNANGSYSYDVPVVSGQTYHIDPAIATGYVYKIGAGDPNFASVTLPSLQSALDDLSYVWNGTTYNTQLAGGSEYNFGLGGVDQFTVTGIDQALALDPMNPTSFITGLTFAGDGTFTGTQTPITAEVAAAPTPATLPLFATGLALIGLFGRCTNRVFAAVAS